MNGGFFWRGRQFEFFFLFDGDDRGDRGGLWNLFDGGSSRNAEFQLLSSERVKRNSFDTSERPSKTNLPPLPSSLLPLPHPLPLPLVLCLLPKTPPPIDLPTFLPRGARPHRHPKTPIRHILQSPNNHHPPRPSNRPRPRPPPLLPSNTPIPGPVRDHRRGDGTRYGTGDGSRHGSRHVAREDVHCRGTGTGGWERSYSAKGDG